MKHKRKLLVNLGATNGSGTGTQPKLFSPIINVNGNTVTWERDDRNGGFNDTLEATVDGNAVSTPLYLNAALNNKTLVVKSEADDFRSASNSETLHFISVTPTAKKTTVVIDTLSPLYQPGGAYEEYTILEIEIVVRIDYNSVGWGNENMNKATKHMKFVCDGVEYPLDIHDADYIGNTFKLQIPIQTGKQDFDLYLDIFEDFTFDNPGDNYIIFGIYRKKSNGSSGSERDGIVRGTTYGFLDDIPAGYNYSSESNPYRVRFDIDGSKGVYTAYFDARSA